MCQPGCHMLRRPPYDLAASDGAGVGYLSVTLLVVGLIVAILALRKYLRGDTDTAVLLGVFAVVAVFMASGVLAK